MQGSSKAAATGWCERVAVVEIERLDTSVMAIRNANFTGAAADNLIAHLEVYLDLLNSKFKDKA